MPSPCTIGSGPSEGQEVCLFVEMEGDNFPEGINTDGHSRCFVGLLDVVVGGETECFGCDVGCSICLDDPTQMHFQGTDTRGRRFLRGRLPNDPLRPNRNAKNQRADLIANVPELIPSQVVYERASCHLQRASDDRTECFGHHVCSCWEHPSTVPAGTRCVDTTPIGQPMSGFWPDSNFVDLNKWPPDLHCRKFLGPRDAGIRVGSRNNQTVFIATHHGEGDFPCAANHLVPCSSQVARSSDCDPCVGWVEGERPQQGQYISRSDVCGQIWDNCDLFSPSIGILPGTSETPDETQQRLIRNRAIGKVFREGFAFPDGSSLGVTFNELTHRHVQNSQFVDLGHYARFWEGASLPLDELPAIDFDLSETRTRFGGEEDEDGNVTPGCPVNAQVVIHKVQVDMYLHLEHTKTWLLGDDDFRHFATPYAVFEVGIWLTTRVSLPETSGEDGGCVVDGSPTFITSSENHGPLPTVSPDGNRIRYGNADAQFIQIPTKVEWKGWLSNLSDLPTAARPYIIHGSIRKSCARIVDAVGEFTIGGLSTHLTSNERDPVKVYGGSIGISFKSGAGFLGCVRSDDD